MIIRVMFWEQMEICWNDVQKPNNEKQRQTMSEIMTSLEVSQSSTGPDKINRLRAQYLSATFEVGVYAQLLRVLIPKSHLVS